MYSAMLKRQAVQMIEQQKMLMIAAVYSNINYGKDDIQKAVEQLEKHYKEAIETVYALEGDQKKKQQGQDPDWNNPFWAGAKRSYDRQRQAAKELGLLKSTTRNMTAEEAVAHHERRRKQLETTDQMAPKRH